MEQSLILHVPDIEECDIQEACGCGNSLFTLAPGASVTVHVTSPNPYGSCGQYANQAFYSSTNGGSAPSAPAYVDVRCPP